MEFCYVAKAILALCDTSGQSERTLNAPINDEFPVCTRDEIFAFFNLYYVQNL